MGEIIAFRMREKRARAGSAAPAGGAQILFFLGVRYVRMDEPPATLLAPDKGRGPAGGKKRKSRARA
jgi:hypothetical protein